MSKSTMDKHGVEASSSLATTEDICKRLTRPPPPPHSQQSSSSVTASHLYELQHRNSSQSALEEQRKLTRAPDQQSSSSVIAPHLYELQHDNSSKSNSDTSPLQKRRKSRAVKVKNHQKLEDYFDVSLLSAIRAKMNSSLKKQSRKMKVKSDFEEFVWPTAGDYDSEVFSERSRRTDEAIVDLKNDDDDDDSFGVENHVTGLDTFQRFESTALMQFKR